MARSSEPTHEQPRAHPRGAAAPSRMPAFDDKESAPPDDAGPIGRSYDEDTDWRSLGVFGLGIAVGLALGAGVALLTAPRTGADTRELIGERARLTRDRVSGRWDDLRDEVGHLTRRGRRKIRRGAVLGRWKTEDVLDRQRRKGLW